ncbi:hypothetical protein PoB_005765600 [Plakobranchus ocellatus]|uniref:Uncharacterized protein n=1 Tax=Plakobranchus ocellatus TaxID=259542 RepID=A0AAV4C790_9GAST|nr:hypothetical protein PoB_005765600 [Plakobranchus ocellatus]
MFQGVSTLYDLRDFGCFWPGAVDRLRNAPDQSVRRLSYRRRSGQSDLRLSDPLSGQGARVGARPRDRMVPTDLRINSQSIVPPTCNPCVATRVFDLSRREGKLTFGVST